MTVTDAREFLRAWRVATEAALKAATPGPWKPWADEGMKYSLCAARFPALPDEDPHRECVASFSYGADGERPGYQNAVVAALAVNALPASILAIRALVDAAEDCPCNKCQSACTAIIAVAESLRAGGFHA